MVLVGMTRFQGTWGSGDSRVADLQCVQLHVYLVTCLACSVPMPVLTGWDKKKQTNKKKQNKTLIQGNKNNS